MYTNIFLSDQRAIHAIQHPTTQFTKFFHCQTPEGILRGKEHGSSKFFHCQTPEGILRGKEHGSSMARLQACDRLPIDAN